MSAVAGALRRDIHVVGLISSAHLLSHIYLFCLVPLYAVIRTDLNITYAEIGIAATVFAVFIGGLQAPMGFLVDRLGGRKVLCAGLLVNAAAMGMIGFVDSYWQLVLLLALAGAGSSVFHPADYAILSVSVEDKRLGRAFAWHTMGGHLGTVLVAPLMVALQHFMGWRSALMFIGSVGVVLAFVLLALSGVIGDGGKSRKKESAMAGWRKLLSSRPVMLFFVYYFGSSAANAGMVHFSMPAFGEIYGLPLVATAWALTAYQAMGLLTVLPGGWLADRTLDRDWLLVGCFGGAAILVVVAGLGLMPFWMVVITVGCAGGLRGLINAARDVSVRHAAGSGLSVGTVFGFVTIGYSVGQSIGPPVYGWLLDFAEPQIVFWTSAAFSMISVATVFIGRATRARPAMAE